MRKSLIVLFALLALPLSAQQRVTTYEQLTVAGSSVGITVATTLRPNSAGQPQMAACSLRLETAEIRYRMDGTAPTSSVGTPLEPGEIIPYIGYADALAIRFIRTTSTSGVLNINCWPQP